MLLDLGLAVGEREMARRHAGRETKVQWASPSATTRFITWEVPNAKTTPRPCRRRTVRTHHEPRDPARTAVRCRCRPEETDRRRHRLFRCGAHRHCSGGARQIVPRRDRCPLLKPGAGPITVEARVEQLAPRCAS